MGFDDMCHEFIHGYIGKRIPLAQLVRELIDSCDGYEQTYSEQRGYSARGSGKVIDTVRRTAKRVLDHPDDRETLNWLLQLTDIAQGSYGAGIDPDRWCAHHLEQLQRVGNDQCPECGKPNPP